MTQLVGRDPQEARLTEGDVFVEGAVEVSGKAVHQHVGGDVKVQAVVATVVRRA